MKILVVDDSKAMRMIVIRTLKQAGFSGHTIVQAADGVEALEKVNEETPDLILSDWNMPNMKGIDLLRNIRAANNPVRFGFITSESSREVQQEATDAGANFIITKPFSADTMRMVLEPVMS